MINKQVKLVAIVGPTASGKTEMSLKLAEKYNGEIVCADSRTIYRGMDIGTAKPTAEERQGRAPHHLIDIIDPDQSLSAGEFKRLADAAINDIWARGRVPILVGGSGLYVDSVIYEYDFPATADPELRQKLDAMSDDELRDMLFERDPEFYAEVDVKNHRRLVRAIEVAGQPRSKRAEVRPNTLVIAPNMDKEIIKERIKLRVAKMVDNGFIAEVRAMGEKYGFDCEGFGVIGYKAFKDVVFGQKTIDEGMADFAKGDTMLLKKQLTWFKRNQSIHWLGGFEEADALVGDFLKTSR
jgi:tRNA dimethylallyltransferase